MKYKPRTQTIEKYLDVLEKIHKAITNGKNDLNFVHIMKHFKVNRCFAKTIIDLGIIENKKEFALNKSSRHYIWNAAKPDYRMAKEVAKAINLYQTKRVVSEKVDLFTVAKEETPIISKAEPKPVVKSIYNTDGGLAAEKLYTKQEKQKVEVSLFWGLIKFNMNSK